MQGYTTKCRPPGKDEMKIPSKAEPQHNRVLNNAETVEYTATFDLFDKAHVGAVPVKNLGIMIRAAGMNPTDAQVEDMKKEAQKTDNDIMNIDEFLKFMLIILSSRTPEEELMDAFRIFDIDDNGYVLVEEMRYIMTNLGEKLSPEEVECMISQGDPNKTGKIDYKEFVALLLSDEDE